MALDVWNSGNVALLLTPAAYFAPFGLTLDPVGTLLARLLGGVLNGVGLLSRAARDMRDEGAQRGLTRPLFVGDSLGFVN